MESCCNWGQYPKVEAEVFSTDRYDDLASLVKSELVLIARGNGRCYGDSALQKKIYSTLSLNKCLEFDVQHGILHAEAGILLADILQIIVPNGFFLPVTPGTKWVTLGGAVASNIHGKNHHKGGAIGRYIDEITVMTDNGDIITCTPSLNSDLFKSTIGGMGLSGIILHLKLRLKKIETSFMVQEKICLPSLKELLEKFETNQDSSYSVAWIDAMAKGKSLGRSVLFLGEHALPEDLPLPYQNDVLRVHEKTTFRLPFTFPSFFLGKAVAKFFNQAYLLKEKVTRTSHVLHYDQYFYPLDAIDQWNKFYGYKGFLQYQFVLPLEHGLEGLTKILQKISYSNSGAYLAVLKQLGEADEMCSPLSFPMKGYTLAVDFKVSNTVFKLMDELDQLVLKYAGRLYLTKDARMSKEMFAATYAGDQIKVIKFKSLQSERLGL